MTDDAPTIVVPPGEAGDEALKEIIPVLHASAVAERRRQQ